MTPYGPLLAVVVVLAAQAAAVTAAGSFSFGCVAVFYLNSGLKGDSFNVTLDVSDAAPSARTLVQDFAKLPVDGFDDTVSSAILTCTCQAGDCAEALTKVLLKVYPSPFWKVNEGVKGGKPTQLVCQVPVGSTTECKGLWNSMPGGFDNRISAAALLYNLPDFVPGDPAPLKSPPSPSAATPPKVVLPASPPFAAPHPAPVKMFKPPSPKPPKSAKSPPPPKKKKKKCGKQGKAPCKKQPPPPA